MILGDCAHPIRGGHPACDVEGGCVKWEPKRANDSYAVIACGLCRWFQERPIREPQKKQQEGTANGR